MNRDAPRRLALASLVAAVTVLFTGTSTTADTVASHAPQTQSTPAAAA